MVFAWLKKGVEAVGLLIAKVRVWLDTPLRSMVFCLAAFAFSLTVVVARSVGDDAFSWERAAGYFVITIVAIAPFFVIPALMRCRPAPGGRRRGRRAGSAGA